MKITIFGSRYVGLVQGAVMAETGHSVFCVDVDRGKIDRLNSGEVPIYEPGLKQMIEKNAGEGRLFFTADSAAGVKHGEIIFIAVGTPQGTDGSADLKYVKAAAADIARYMGTCKVVVNKSTVPVGTADMLKTIIEEEQRALKKDVAFDVVSNPEFLREGAAVTDCLNPDRIVVGSGSSRAVKLMRGLYSCFLERGTPFLEMDVRSAELTKYAANCMLAAKISFMNEIAGLAEVLGADAELVRQGIGSDPRIGRQFINPGCGFGGACFPKDTRALVSMAEKSGRRPRLLCAVDEVNNEQKEKLFSLIHRHYRGNVRGLTLALWGLAFKPETDDMREAPSRVLMERLWQNGAEVRAFDPVAAGSARALRRASKAGADPGERRCPAGSGRPGNLHRVGGIQESAPRANQRKTERPGYFRRTQHL